MLSSSVWSSTQMSPVFRPKQFSLYFMMYSKVVVMASSVSTFVYNETTSNDTGIIPVSWPASIFSIRWMHSAVLFKCADTCFKSGLSRCCRSHPSLSKIPPQAETRSLRSARILSLSEEGVYAETSEKFYLSSVLVTHLCLQ